MSKDEIMGLFIALCGDARTRFEVRGIAMAGRAHEGFWIGTDRAWRSATIRTPNGDEFTMTLTDLPGQYQLGAGGDLFPLTADEYGPLRRAFDRGNGQRDVAKVDDVRQMLGL
ncbi:MAG TPA: hypothetical protein PLB89_04865 [Flavobacteriales bacterium]|nr:hypothetical protein [Flavobacteriales bacterium]